MHRFILAVLVAVALLCLAPVFALAAECKPNAQEQGAFLSSVQKQNIKVMSLTPEGQAIMTVFYKSVTNGAFPDDAVTFIGVIPDGRVGLVSFSKGCTVDRSVEAMPVVVFDRLMKVIGIKPEHMKPYVGGDPA